MHPAVCALLTSNPCEAPQKHPIGEAPSVPAMPSCSPFIPCTLSTMCSFIHSFITRLPIHRSGAFQQAFTGSPPACPVLGLRPPYEREPCKVQVFPDMIHPLLLTPANV